MLKYQEISKQKKQKTSEKVAKDKKHAEFKKVSCLS
jgi:hypothetical protein